MDLNENDNWIPVFDDAKRKSDLQRYASSFAWKRKLVDCKLQKICKFSIEYEERWGRLDPLPIPLNIDAAYDRIWPNRQIGLKLVSKALFHDEFDIWKIFA